MAWRSSRTVAGTGPRAARRVHDGLTAAQANGLARPASLDKREIRAQLENRRSSEREPNEGPNPVSFGPLALQSVERQLTVPSL